MADASHLRPATRAATTIRPGIAWSVVGGFLAAWLAAGSLGVLAVSLQNLLALLALAASVLGARPHFVRARWLWALASASALLVLSRWMRAPADTLVLIVAMMLGWVSTGLQGRERRILALASLGVLSLAIFRFAQQSLPAVWMLSDQIGSVLGLAAGALTGRPLTIGASFGGLDFLLVVTVFYVGWSLMLRQNRRASLIMALVAMIVAHLAYLSLLSLLNEVARLIPPVPAPGPDSPYVPPPFSWAVVLRQLVPWNMPALAAGLHAVLVLVLVRSGVYAAPHELVEESHRGAMSRAGRMAFVVAILAVMIPIWGMVCHVGRLEGKRIVANAQGQLDWNRPQHDQYGHDSAGTLGVLPAFVESLGATLHTSAQFSQAELDAADLLLVVEPDASLTRDQQDRIWDYVRDGGSLLVVTEGFSAENGLQRTVNELLQDTSIAVRSDAAVSETRDWWGSLRALHHPAMQAASPHVARIVSDQGASLSVGWPARPLLAGLWGRGTAEPMTRDEDRWGYQEGQRLGDLALAAEQKMGAGRVVVVGDVTCLSNEGLADGYPWVSDLLSYLASSANGPQAMWRQAGLAATLIALLILLTRNPTGARIAVCSACLALALMCCQSFNAAASLNVPDGTRIATPTGSPVGSRLAYIDATHLEPASRQDWGFDSLNGLVLNLQRNGYLPLMLHDHLVERLPGAGLFISIAPAQAFSRAELQQVRQFVEEGGSLICMAGAEDAAASANLLAELGLNVPVSPVPTDGTQYEPEPFGRTKADYLQIEQDDGTPYNVSVRLHAAWPVETRKVNSENTEVIAYARNTLPYVESDTELPAILLHSVKRGLVVLIGDTDFAMNRNLEYFGGEPFAFRHENALFWRWLLTQLKGEPQWVPPRPPEPPASTEEADSEEMPSSEEES